MTKIGQISGKALTVGKYNGIIDLTDPRNLRSSPPEKIKYGQ